MFKRVVQLLDDGVSALCRIADALEAKFIFLNWKVQATCPKCAESSGTQWLWRAVDKDGKCPVCGWTIITKEGPVDG